jgi:hypothetical protein
VESLERFHGPAKVLTHVLNQQEYTSMSRNLKGQFTAGNTFAKRGGKARARSLTKAQRRAIARAGWEAMVEQQFGGDEALAKEWWGRIGKWASDVAAGYAGTHIQVFHHPGSPEEFRRRRQILLIERQQAMEFTLGQLKELAF